MSKSSSKVIVSSQHLPVPRRPMRVMNVARSGQRCVPRSRVPQSGHSYTVWGAAAFWPECRGGDERAMTATIRGLAASVETPLPSVGISLPPFTRRKPRSAWSIPVTVAGRQDGTGATPEGPPGRLRTNPSSWHTSSRHAPGSSREIRHLRHHQLPHHLQRAATSDNATLASLVNPASRATGSTRPSTAITATFLFRVGSFPLGCLTRTPRGPTRLAGPREGTATSLQQRDGQPLENASR